MILTILEITLFVCYCIMMAIIIDWLLMYGGRGDHDRPHLCRDRSRSTPFLVGRDAFRVGLIHHHIHHYSEEI
jgi:hypothetical protein